MLADDLLRKLGDKTENLLILVWRNVLSAGRLWHRTV